MSKLWPQPIPILGLTGEYATGKTWFGLSIAPDPKRVRVYDLEMSATPYVSLGFEHVNVPQELQKKFPKGAKAIDLWNWWVEDVTSLPADKYDVVLVDPVTDLESGLTDWVEAHPEHFGHTKKQYEMMSGIKWGDVKDHWKAVLAGRVATKCQTFAFVAHLGAEFDKVSKKATGERRPKGKETLMELATLYLQMERPKDKTGGRRGVPSAIVLKSRLNHLTITADGPTLREALPPRLPTATPNEVRRYMLNPPDMANLKPEEKAPERVMTDDERLRLQVAKAEAERDVAMYAADKIDRPAAQEVKKEPPEHSPEGKPAGWTYAGHLEGEIAAVQTEDALPALAEKLKTAVTQKHVKPAEADKLRVLYGKRRDEIKKKFAEPQSPVAATEPADPVATDDTKSP